MLSKGWDCPVGEQRVIDGDTIDLEILLPAKLSLRSHCRLLAGSPTQRGGLDAPESSTLAGQRVADYVALRLQMADVVRTWWLADDKYAGRYLGLVTVDGADLGSLLLAKGLARPYGGGHRPDWSMPDLLRIADRAAEAIRLAGDRPRARSVPVMFDNCDRDIDIDVLSEALARIP